MLWYSDYATFQGRKFKIYEGFGKFIKKKKNIDSESKSYAISKNKPGHYEGGSMGILP